MSGSIPGLVEERAWGTWHGRITLDGWGEVPLHVHRSSVNTEPAAAQVASYDWLRAQSGKLRGMAVAAAARLGLDPGSETFEASLTLLEVDVHPTNFDGLAYTGLRFRTPSGEVIGVLTHGERVVRAGDADTAILPFMELLGPDGKPMPETEGVRLNDLYVRLCRKEEREPLTEAERFLVAVWDCKGEVDNGGFEQFFSNSSKRHAPYLAAAFSAMGFNDWAEIARRAVEAVGPGGVGATVGLWTRLRLSRFDKAFDKAGLQLAEPVGTGPERHLQMMASHREFERRVAAFVEARGAEILVRR